MNRFISDGGLEIISRAADNTLQTNLLLARKAKGWTLREAELQTGVKVVTIGSYERGYRLPPINTLQILAAHYDTTVGALLGEKCPTCEIVSDTLQNQVISLKEAINELKEATNG